MMDAALIRALISALSSSLLVQTTLAITLHGKLALVPAVQTELKHDPVTG